jgi:hypothetical protein
MDSQIHHAGHAQPETASQQPHVWAPHLVPYLLSSSQTLSSRWQSPASGRLPSALIGGRLPRPRPPHTELCLFCAWSRLPEPPPPPPAAAPSSLVASPVAASPSSAPRRASPFLRAAADSPDLLLLLRPRPRRLPHRASPHLRRGCRLPRSPPPTASMRDATSAAPGDGRGSLHPTVAAGPSSPSRTTRRNSALVRPVEWRLFYS